MKYYETLDSAATLLSYFLSCQWRDALSPQRLQWLTIKLCSTLLRDATIVYSESSK
jgi:hypothetical protein